MEPPVRPGGQLGRIPAKRMAPASARYPGPTIAASHAGRPAPAVRQTPSHRDTVCCVHSWVSPGSRGCSAANHSLSRRLIRQIARWSPECRSTASTHGHGASSGVARRAYAERPPGRSTSFRSALTTAYADRAVRVTADRSVTRKKQAQDRIPHLQTVGLTHVDGDLLIVPPVNANGMDTAEPPLRPTLIAAPASPNVPGWSALVRAPTRFARRRTAKIAHRRVTVGHGSDQNNEPVDVFPAGPDPTNDAAGAHRGSCGQ